MTIGVSSLVVFFLAAITMADNVRDVVPKCSPEAKICEYEFTITEQETMVYYNRLKYKGYPVLKENGTFFRRLPENCNELEPLAAEDLDTVVTADGRYRVAYFINDHFPGPTIVVYEGQQVVVRVHNQLLQEGTSIHWHGMVQRNTPWMDGVPAVTQCAINPEESFTYRFKAYPTGTHWYHSHYGTQRTDGLFGALVVLERPKSVDDNKTPKDNNSKEKNKTKTTKDDTAKSAEISPIDETAIRLGWELNEVLGRFNHDVLPTQIGCTFVNNLQIVLPDFDRDFMLMVQDWFRDESRTILTRYLAELQRFTDGYDDLDKCHYKTQQPDGSEVGTIGFESALINGKGRYNPYKSSEPKVEVPLETFEVMPDKHYRFRVINPSLNFAFRISIDEHPLHIIASDGNAINPVTADAVIVHGGERFDFYIKTMQNGGRFWIRAETLESYNGRPYEWDHPLRKEKPGEVRAILHYEGSPESYPDTYPKHCSANNPCTVVNCPFLEYPDDKHTNCINMEQITSPKSYSLPTPQDAVFYEKFLNFHFPAAAGGVLRSMVNGRQFKQPSSPPLIYGDRPLSFACDEEKCNAGELCTCTHALKLPYGSLVQLVLLSHVTPIPWEGVPASAHPVHIHGHHFHVLKVGYPEIDPITKRYKAMNPDLKCPTDRCHNATFQDPTWLGGNIPGLNELNPPLKDTVIVPAGGYVVIRFLADNPGWWIMHCHLELHQVEGMALLLQEGEEWHMNPAPRGFPTCGGFDWSMEEYEEKLNKPPMTSTETPVTDIQDTNSAQSLTSRYRSTESFVWTALIFTSEILVYFHLIPFFVQ